MTEPKFTKGPWYVLLEGSLDVFVEPGILYKNVQRDYDNYDEVVANARLIAVSPEMYDSEEKNLSMLKVILEGYEAMAGVALSDPDTKAAIEDGTLARQLPCAMPDAIGEIIMKLKARITETEALLAKARGEAEP